MQIIHDHHVFKIVQIFIMNFILINISREMADNFFEDLEKLFEECDNVSRTFYKSDIKESTYANAPDRMDTQDETRVCPHGEKPTILNEDVSERSAKCNLKTLQTDEQKTNTSHSELESSKEEGECTRSFVESKISPVVVCSKPSTVLEQKMGFQKCVKNLANYSSFIDSSKEDGECSTTSFEEDELETTIKAVSPEKASQKCSENDKSVITRFPKKDLQRDLTGLNICRKRKRSLFGENESTPKRRHLFVTEDLLSPISCCSADKRKNVIEVEETPIINCKFSLQADNVCSSTPVTTEQKYIIPASTQCSTPIAASHSKKHKHVAKKEILKTDVSSDSDSEFITLNRAEITNEKDQTVEEIIAEITQLCEDSNENLKTETENVTNFDKSLSKIEVNNLINEWKTRSSCECSSESSNSDFDKTLTEKVQDDNQSKDTDHTHSDLGNLTVVTAESALKKKETGKTKDKTADRDGRFKAEVTVCRIEGEDGNETNREHLDMDICDCDEGEIQYGDDLLKLNDYDDEGFVDENILENSHLTKRVQPTVKNKDDKNDKGKEGISNDTSEGKGKKTVENVRSVFNLVQSLQKQTENENKVDANKNLVRGLDYAAFDSSIYRKKDNTAIEREVCRHWGTDGSADPDLNLTVATTKRNKCRKMGQELEAGILEGDKVVCTNLYENEIMATFKQYGKTDGQSDLFYMSLENLLAKLYHQKEILNNRNKQTLINLRHEIILQLEQTKARHSMELTALKQRLCNIILLITFIIFITVIIYLFYYNM